VNEDRLYGIKARLTHGSTAFQPVPEDDVEWLIREIDRLRALEEVAGDRGQVVGS
jgi:hypothetical protein